MQELKDSYRRRLENIADCFKVLVELWPRQLVVGGGRSGKSRAVVVVGTGHIVIKNRARSKARGFSGRIWFSKIHLVHNCVLKNPAQLGLNTFRNSQSESPSGVLAMFCDISQSV